MNDDAMLYSQTNSTVMLTIMSGAPVRKQSTRPRRELHYCSCQVFVLHLPC